jgi:4-diphosphocytidyl-2-C-methyl-D-erythritol kinase
LRAARALGVSYGAAIMLEKNLPIASGIGGGSSDAAAALIALIDLWGLAIDGEPIARSLGADVPVCLHRDSAYMTGAGETFVPLKAPVLHAVLVNPLQPLATADVYRRFDAMDLGGAFSEQPKPELHDASAAIAYAKAIGNDLFAPAAALMPVIAEIADTLSGDPRVRHAGLSGSGATLFALVDGPEDAATLAAGLSARRRDWWVEPTRLGAA